MSEERNKMHKSSTGTVPKIKCRNNGASMDERNSSSGSWTNNLAAVDVQRLNITEQQRKSRIRNLPLHNYDHNYCSATMNFTVEEQRVCNPPSLNGSFTPNTSSTASRRSSTGTVPKCDNVAKYPDKKQIEDKLSQIREYLQITSSLMSSVKNTDEQMVDESEKNSITKMYNDLKDSEAKLVNILANLQAEDESDRNDSAQLTANGSDSPPEPGTSNSHNDLDEKIYHTNREMEQLRQQSSFLTLQEKAENKLREARHIQERLMAAQYENGLNSVSNRDKNLSSIQDIDLAIRELEERTKQLNEPRASNSQDKLLAEVDSLHSQIVSLHNVNGDRQQLLHVLDNRDSQLRAEHMELQSKLSELQNRKLQVDQLVDQLHNLDDVEEAGDDVGSQVRNIVTMKDQLSKLKDMLEIVKSTETVMQNGTPEEQELACAMCAKAEHLLMNVEKSKTPMHNQQNESSVALRNDAAHKQVNKSAVSCDRRQGAAARNLRSVSNDKKMALQVELQAKKRELEDIMGKHKAGTSNLNHDVGTDNKSEYSCSSAAFFDSTPDGWVPSEHNRFDSSESEDCDADFTQDLNGHHHHQNQQFSLPVLNQPRDKRRSSNHNADYIQVVQEPIVPRPSERNVRSSSACGRTRATSNSEQSTKNQVQKQLELIRSVCDSMLDQQQQQQQQQCTVQQLRNNLTPSPLYSEPRQFASPTLNPIVEQPSWNEPPPPANYQNWLAQNTLQTQAFMLNTLNQCCQMLWLQQREMANLRQLMQQMQQERIDTAPTNYDMTAAEGATGRATLRPSPKVNQACSLPNLNQYNIMPGSVNLNDPNARLLDPCLNNAHLNSDHSINNGHANAANNLWNGGPALNNQVAPGNRANNYWDNFRSYSRQNLLSTKSNEGYQNVATIERPPANNPFTVIALSKCNENTPPPPRRTRNNERSNPPDVLNINHNANKTNDGPAVEYQRQQRNSNENDELAQYSFNEVHVNNSNVPEEHVLTLAEHIRRNEWRGESNEEPKPNSKLSEDLRENVYKEVVSLISTNESRPHYLIQLFRDLQLISSDPLRLKILQAIQGIITHSLAATNHIRPVAEGQIPNESFSLKSTVWSKAVKSPPCSTRNTILQNCENVEPQNPIKELLPFLNDHEDEFINSHFVNGLKQVVMESDSFRETVRDSIFKKHFSNILDEVLTQYHGKQVRDMKMHLIQAINELLRGELSFIQLIHDTCPENNEQSETVLDSGVGHPPQIENGDLAEADQGRAEEDVEEEGAVGGFWDLQPIEATNLVQVNLEEVVLQNNNETQFIKQGLDQVPTRLPTTTSKSRSNTPNRGD